MKMMLQWQQRLPIQNMGLHFPRSLHLITQRQCAEVDEITDYMVMSAFMIFKSQKSLGRELSVKVAYIKLRTPVKVENSFYYPALTQ
jgi:hypothetical protein